MQLGMALKLMGDTPRSQQALDLALKTPRNDSRNWMADYGSQLRDNALMLSLLEEYKLLPDAQNRLLNALSENAFSQRWLSTGRAMRCSGWTFTANLVRRVAGNDHPL